MAKHPTPKVPSRPKASDSIQWLPLPPVPPKLPNRRHDPAPDRHAVHVAILHELVGTLSRPQRRFGVRYSFEVLAVADLAGTYSVANVWRLVPVEWSAGMQVT
jgi:hypothetical protein